MVTNNQIQKVKSEILRACNTLLGYQKELVSLLASEFQIKKEEVFYIWAFRKCKQRGILLNTEWRYIFHGLECDFINTDGRFLRVDFGPNGTLETFTPWGVFQFINTSKWPWLEFPDLKQYLSDHNSNNQQNNAAYNKLLSLFEGLEKDNLIKVADEKLIEYSNKFTTYDKEGICHVIFPRETPEKTIIDCSVAHRKKLSEKAYTFLLENRFL